MTKRQIDPTTGLPKVFKQEKKKLDALDSLVMNANIMSRSMLANRLGTQFGGARDLYETFGYIRDPQYRDYKNLYDRQGMASRVAEIFPIDTWNLPPVFIDGDSRSDLNDEQLTPFLKAWKDLAQRLKVWQVLKEVDIMSSIGRYSVIFMGTDGSFEQPLGSRAVSLSYITAIEEPNAIIQALEDKPNDARYGLPSMYTLKFMSLLGEVSTKETHYSRIIHVAQNRVGSKLYGQPVLQKVINRLFDLEKVTGGGAEAAWLAIYKGMLFTAKEGSDLPDPESPEGKYLDEQIQAYVHRIQRFAVLNGVETKDMGVEEVNVKNIFETLIADLAGSLGIPQRILLGSERGELGSSQDMRHWNGLIESRRTHFAEPDILRPFVEWCIIHGIIPPPKSGYWTCKWNSVFTLNEIELGQYAKSVADGANAVTGGMPELAISPDEFRAIIHLPPVNQSNLESSQAIIDAKDKQAADTLKQPTIYPPPNGKANGNGRPNIPPKTPVPVKPGTNAPSK